MSEIPNNANETKWTAQFDRLLQHMESNDGQVPYPRKGQDAALESIGQWVSKQRKLWRAGTLEDHRIQRLIGINGVLTARQYGDYAEKLPDAAGLESVRKAVRAALDSSERVSFTADEAFNVVETALNELVIS